MQQRAVFLDRDGVLNQEIGNYVTTPEAFQVLPHVISNLQKLQQHNFRLIVITNQGGIAKGLYTKNVLQQIHAKFLAVCAENGVVIDEIFYCPHHPDFGKCLCRKPGSLMIQKALAKYRIDASKSFMIGDAERDMQAANDAGVTGFRISPNENWDHITGKILEMSR